MVEVLVTGGAGFIGSNSVRWAPLVPFEHGRRDTIEQYRTSERWWRPIKERDPAFQEYYRSQYGTRQ